jgi:hypothetical protein
MLTDGVMVCERFSKGFFAINKTGRDFEQQIHFSSLNGSYSDLFDKENLLVEDKKCLIKVPARGVKMFLAT